MNSVAQRSLLLALCSLLVLALAPGRAIAAEKAIRIRDVSLDSFPTVELIVSSSDELEASQVTVEEDGQPLEVAVEPLDQTGQAVEVVLVIDASGSMIGAPMKAALSAARAFVREVPNHVTVGVVAFSTSARKVVRLGAPRAAVIRGIDRQNAAGETAMFDGVRRAVSMFDTEETQRNIVLLSDGGDTASRTNLAAAARAADRADAAIFAVGLKTTETDVRALKKLASATGGRYQPAATANLGTVYGELATELSSQFALSYESSAESGSDVTIHAITPFGADTITVLAPKAGGLDVHEASEPTPPEPPAPPPGWLLPMALALCFAAAFALSISFFSSSNRKRRESRLRRALPEMRSDPSRTEGQEANRSAADWLPDAVVSAGGRLATRAGFRDALDAKLERASIALKPDEFVGISLVAALGGYLSGGILLSSFMLTIVLTLVGAVGPWLWLNVMAKRRMSKLNEQIPDILTVLASSLRAGHSFLQALDMAAREIDDPGASEFQRVVAEIRLGRTITDALDAMGDRIGSDGFSWAILAVNIQREVGGNLAELLDSVAETLRTRDKLKRQVKTLSAEGRLSMYVLAALPVLIAGYMSMVNPEYIGLLVTTGIGRVMLVSGISLLAAGFLWMRKVVAIDV